jgi:mxaD protein
MTQSPDAIACPVAAWRERNQRERKMIRIVESVQVDEGPDTLWRDVGRFGAVGEWHPWLTRVESEGDREGSLRIPEDRDGNLQTERLLETSPERHFYRYRMESTAIPVHQWSAELRVAENQHGGSTVIWSAEFEPKSSDPKIPDGIRSFMRAGLDNMARLHRSRAS